MKSDFESYLNPALGERLRRLKLDKTYTKGLGTLLFDEYGTRYLDFVGAYGALPFGHSCPTIAAAIQDALDDNEPTLVQPSSLKSAGKLAKYLINLAPGKMKACYFTNSGAEAVEAAIKVAFAKTKRSHILTTVMGFHGKTLGALSATWNPDFQTDFFVPYTNFHAVPYGDVDALKGFFHDRGHSLAAFIVEPIQGEAGAIVPPQGYLQVARKLCHQYSTLFIVDEIQTGLGRTGHLFCSDTIDGGPDILTLSKALGGGIMPIGACLVNELAYSDIFSLKHSSTFAGNMLACKAGIATLDLLLANDRAILKRVLTTGSLLKSRLNLIFTKFPGVAKLHGEGLLLGLELTICRQYKEPRFGSYLSILNEQGALVPLVASYLLNVEKIRLAPALNGSSTLRIEPPLTVKTIEIEQFLQSIERVIALLFTRNTSRLLAHLCDQKPTHENDLVFASRKSGACNQLVKYPGEISRFAFLIHPLTFGSFLDFDTSLCNYSDAALQKFENELLPLIEPFVAASTIIRSKTGVRIYGEFIMVPRTAKQFNQADGLSNLELLETSIELAKERGAQIVGLGAYTSIASRGGVSLSEQLPLTTGNSCTLLISVDATRQCLALRGKKLADIEVAIVGAAGSIGASAVRLYLLEACAITLIGNPISGNRNSARFVETLTNALLYLADVSTQHSGLGRLAQQILKRPEWLANPDDVNGARELASQLIDENGSHVALTWSNDAAQGLSNSDLVFVATSNTERFISPSFLKRHAIVCDISRPANLSFTIRDLRPDVLTIDGGLVAPYEPAELGANFGTSQGSIYACMAETMMLTFAQHFNSTSLGLALKNEDLSLIRDLINEHGFSLSSPTSFDRPIIIKAAQPKDQKRKQSHENHSAQKTQG